MGLRIRLHVVAAAVELARRPSRRRMLRLASAIGAIWLLLGSLWLRVETRLVLRLRMRALCLERQGSSSEVMVRRWMRRGREADRLATQATARRIAICVQRARVKDRRLLLTAPWVPWWKLWVMYN